MADTRLGFVGTLPVGAWSNSTAYKYLDVVTYNGSSYVAKTETVPSGTLPTNTTYWQLMASKGDKGDTGEIISASATITDSFGTPTVVVTAGGTSTERTFAFAFSNLKGNGIESVALLSTSGEEKTYRMTFSDGTHFDYVVTDGEVTEESLAETLEGYATIDGYFEDLTSGSTEEVISNVKITDQEPYTFRTSGGNAEIGSREEDTLVGVSVAFNQMVEHGNFDSDSYWYTYNCTFGIANGIATVTPTNAISRLYRMVSVVLNHKYLMMASFKGTAGEGNAALSWYGGVTKLIPFDGSWQRVGLILDNSFQTTNNWQLHYGSQNNSNLSEYQIRDAICVDLTLMFGSDIADYLYTLEQAQAGEGVALAKKLGLNKYLGYNAGTLYSAQTDAHRMTGFNQWDEEWESGSINTVTGEPSSSPTTIRSKNFCPCLPNTSYYGHAINNPSSFAMFFYDADKNYIGYLSTSSVRNKVFVTPSNARFFKTYFSSTTYNHDICISIHWDNSRDTDYEPYVLHNYPIDPVVLRGILKKDADGNIYADGDTYEADGTVTRKYGIVDLGTLSWGEWGSTETVNQYYSTGLDSLAKAWSDGVCPKFIRRTGSMPAKSPWTFEIIASGNGRTYFRIPINTYASASEFKTAMSGVYLVYELAEPTTEQATPFTTPQIVDNWGTEEYPDYAVAQGDREYSVPMGHTTLYPISIRDKVEASADNPSNDGVYILQMSGGKATYIPLIIEDELPTMPTQDGTYTLKTVVSSGTATLSWVAE